LLQVAQLRERIKQQAEQNTVASYFVEHLQP
jgi:hypothetical protein